MFQKHRKSHHRPMFSPGSSAARHDLFNKHRGDTHLGNVLKASYGNERAMERMRSKGYQLDTSMSNHNQSVWIRPHDKKAVVAIAGTHNGEDVLTDLLFGLGGDNTLRHTKRGVEAQNTLERAKSKYHDFHFTVAGHR